MADLVYVMIFLAFTVLCIAYIGWCDRIIGADEPDNGSAESTEANKEPVMS